MKCDLCKRRAKRLLCDPCADMVRRLVVIDERMRAPELCIAAKMQRRAEEARRKADEMLVQSPPPALNIFPLE